MSTFAFLKGAKFSLLVFRKKLNFAEQMIQKKYPQEHPLQYYVLLFFIM